MVAFSDDATIFISVAFSHEVARRTAMNCHSFGILYVLNSIARMRANIRVTDCDVDMPTCSTAYPRNPTHQKNIFHRAQTLLQHYILLSCPERVLFARANPFRTARHFSIRCQGRVRAHKIRENLTCFARNRATKTGRVP